MIWGTWIDPNFEFSITDREGHRYQHFCYAASEQELRSRLREKRMQVDWVRPYDFTEWKTRAKKATDRAVKAHNEGKRVINFRSEIWSELKFHLFELFHGKCAYCEGKPQAVTFGDVEHYRPKGKVDEDGSHPGYYWLAYDVTNLLPSCQTCNQFRGKMTHFPVNGVRARDPQDLAAEEPLLLNPYNRAIDPFEHLEFNEFGDATAVAGSQYGAQSQQFYHLNRPGLPEARREAIKTVRSSWNSLKFIYAAKLEDARGTLRDEINLGHREYSAAQRAELFRAWAEEKAALPPE